MTQLTTKSDSALRATDPTKRPSWKPSLNSKTRAFGDSVSILQISSRQSVYPRVWPYQRHSNRSAIGPKIARNDGARNINRVSIVDAFHFDSDSLRKTAAMKREATPELSRLAKFMTVVFKILLHNFGLDSSSKRATTSNISGRRIPARTKT